MNDDNEFAKRLAGDERVFLALLAAVAVISCAAFATIVFLIFYLG